MKPLLIVVFMAGLMAAHADWLRQASGTKVQFRGLSAVSAKVCWAAGAEGTYARTIDGAHWTSHQIPGLEKLTFRSVVAWDADHATLLAIGAGELSRIYHTDDGGKHWKLQFQNPDPKAFYDCVQFWDRKNGIAFSDPVDGKFRVITTSDGGKTWKVMPNEGMPNALAGEGAFAASGTCLVVHGEHDAWFATGGAAVSRVFHSTDRGLHWAVAETPIAAGKETSGIFGLTFKNAREGIAVGGDYKSPKEGVHQLATTDDGGRTWKDLVDGTPNGLLECAAYDADSVLLVLGPNRVAGARFTKGSGGHITTHWMVDDGTPDELHTCCFAGKIGWAAGDGGLIIKWTPEH